MLFNAASDYYCLIRDNKIAMPGLFFDGSGAVIKTNIKSLVERNFLILPKSVDSFSAISTFRKFEEFTIHNKIIEILNKHNYKDKDILIKIFKNNFKDKFEAIKNSVFNEIVIDMEGSICSLKIKVSQDGSRLFVDELSEELGHFSTTDMLVCDPGLVFKPNYEIMEALFSNDESFDQTIKNCNKLGLFRTALILDNNTFIDAIEFGIKNSFHQGILKPYLKAFLYWKSITKKSYLRYTDKFFDDFVYLMKKELL